MRRQICIIAEFVVSVSFDADIRPLFQARDIISMRNIGSFDLSKYDDVVKNACNILDRLKSGDMPCDGAWPASTISLFEAWMDEGYPA